MKRSNNGTNDLIAGTHLYSVGNGHSVNALRTTKSQCTEQDHFKILKKRPFYSRQEREIEGRNPTMRTLLEGQKQIPYHPSSPLERILFN